MVGGHILVAGEMLKHHGVCQDPNGIGCKPAGVALTFLRLQILSKPNLLLSSLAILDPRSAFPCSSNGAESFELIVQDFSAYVYPFTNGLPGSFHFLTTDYSRLFLSQCQM